MDRVWVVVGEDGEYSYSTVLAVYTTEEQARDHVKRAEEYKAAAPVIGRYDGPDDYRRSDPYGNHGYYEVSEVPYVRHVDEYLDGEN